LLDELIAKIIGADRSLPVDPDRLAKSRHGATAPPREPGRTASGGGMNHARPSTDAVDTMLVASIRQPDGRVGRTQTRQEVKDLAGGTETAAAKLS
jgi:hypothetical protein